MLALAAEPTVLRGRRFGNAVLVAAAAALPVPELTRRVAGDGYAGRVESGRRLVEFAGGAAMVTDAVAVESPGRRAVFG